MNMQGHYILENQKPVPCLDYDGWARLSSQQKHVSLNYIGRKDWISTIFLGVEHGYECGKPIIFETMIFCEDEKYDQYQERYTDFYEAAARHLEILDAFRNKEDIENYRNL